MMCPLDTNPTTSFVDRFSVSLDAELLAAFDRHLAAKGYVNRSEAVRDLIRDLLYSTKPEQQFSEAVGVILVICRTDADHSSRPLRVVLSDEAPLVIFHTTIPLDDRRECLIVVANGDSLKLKACAGRIRAHRHVESAELSVLGIRE